MKNKTKMAFVASIVAFFAVVFSVLFVNKTNFFGTFAEIQTNDYGCAMNCTAEYYASDIFNKVRSNPKLSGTENIRIIAKASKPSGWFQDITNETVYDSIRSSDFKYDWIHGQLITISGTIKGLNYKTGDIIAFYGTINWVPQSAKRYSNNTVEVLNPTVYKVNDKVDFSLINGDPVYIW